MTSQNDKANNMEINQTMKARSPYKRAIDVYIGHYIEGLRRHWTDEEFDALSSFFEELSNLNINEISKKMKYAYEHDYKIPLESRYIIFLNSKDKLHIKLIRKYAEEIKLISDDIDYYLEINKERNYFEIFKYISVMFFLEKNLLMPPKTINKYLRQIDTINKLEFYREFDDLDFSDTLTFLEDVEKFSISNFLYDVVDEERGKDFWDYIFKEQSRINVQSRFDYKKYNYALKEFKEYLDNHDTNYSMEEDARIFCENYNENIKEEFPCFKKKVDVDKFIKYCKLKNIKKTSTDSKKSVK